MHVFPWQVHGRSRSRVGRTPPTTVTEVGLKKRAPATWTSLGRSHVSLSCRRVSLVVAEALHGGSWTYPGPILDLLSRYNVVAEEVQRSHTITL